MVLLGTLIRYRHLIGYGLAVIALGVMVWYIHHEGYKACQRDVMEKTIDVIEERIEIGNLRPSDAVTVKRLRENSF